MKNTFLTICFTLILFQSGCGSQNNKSNSSITQEIAASKTPSLEEIRTFRDTPEYQAIKDTGHLILKQIYALSDAEKEDDAVDLYFKEKGYILSSFII